VPAADGCLAATRVTLPDGLPPNARPLDLTHVTPAEPHWPLVVMTVLTQLSVGAFATIWLLQLLGAHARLGLATSVSLMVGGLALAASTLHLGRPIHAYRALKMWRRSWLSREVLLFTAFAAVASLYAGALWLMLAAPSAAGRGAGVWTPVLTGLAPALGGLTALLGIGGITASACIYRVPSRPAWNTRLTIVHFMLTAGVLGPLFAIAVGAGDRTWLAAATACMAGAQLVLLAVRFVRVIASDRIELRGTARLLSTVLAPRLVARGLLLAAGGIALPLLLGGSGWWGASGWWAQWGAASLALALALTGEMLGRHLFFVSVVATHMAAPYLALEGEAA
jgi:DMSO reductase anchor subunit